MTYGGKERRITMVFTARVEYYNEYEEKIERVNLFMVAEDFSSAVNNITKYYGKDAVESISIDTFAPENFLEFTEDDEDLFEMVKSKLIKRVVW